MHVSKSHRRRAAVKRKREAHRALVLTLPPRTTGAAGTTGTAGRPASHAGLLLLLPRRLTPLLLLLVLWSLLRRLLILPLLSAWRSVYARVARSQYYSMCQGGTGKDTVG